tara:strand:- start:5928 stop:7787 length:1860 start_codon:yes stop_codon:yes gene_type:complete
LVNPQSDYSAKKGALLVFFAFLVYYLATAMALPYGAGPDYDAHFDGAHFIYAEGRLAVLPEDASKLHFTAYGSTRALRPPLSYLVAAAAAKTLSWTGIDLQILFRAGSALLCALTLSLIFAALNRYLNNRWLALGGVLLVGLLPQFAFIASHLNDDSAAIFSVTFLIYCLIRLLREPVDPTIALLTGTAIGFVLLSKFTAWVFLPVAGLVLVLFARPPAGQWLLSIMLVGVGIMLGGGWWIGFNIWHYGWADPLLFNIGQTISTQYLSVDPERVRSFAKEGVSLADLILRNYNHFLDETLVASIGNLDWLRLRLGLPQYLLYTTVLVIGAVYVPVRWLSFLFSTIRGARSVDLKRLLFESLLFLAIVLQFVAYTLYEWIKEIQIQGKYLLPILMCPVVLFCACVDTIGASPVFKQWRPLLVFGSTVRAIRMPILPVITIGLIFAVHIDALRRFVIPYYHPPAKVLGLGEGFRHLDLTTATPILDTQNIELTIDESGWHMQTTSNDGQIHFAPSVCKYFQTNNILKIDMRSDGPGILQFFWSDGGRFVDRMGQSSMTTKFERGENSLVLPVGTGQCKRLRLDPTNVSGQKILLRSFSIAPLKIIRWPYYFRIFSSSTDYR